MHRNHRRLRTRQNNPTQHLTNAPDHYRTIRWDNPRQTKPSQAQITAIPSGQTNHPIARRTKLNTQPRQSAHAPNPNRNRAVPRTQGRTRTRLTTTKNNQHTAQTAHAPTPWGTQRRRRSRNLSHEAASTSMGPCPIPQQRTAVLCKPGRWTHSLVETIGFEPMTPCLQSRCSTN